MEQCMDIERAKRLLKEHNMKNKRFSNVAFSLYDKSYFFTNENIDGYLKLVDFEGKTSALSVLASGDHTFNLICKGIKNVDTFDINRLTEYFALGLKRAMILKYNYTDFLLNMKYLCSDGASIDYITDTIKDLFPYMEEKHRKFWQEILDYNYKMQKGFILGLNLIQMLTVNFMSIENRVLFNTYLKDEESYNRLKQNLVNANITFKNADAVSLHKEFNGEYDLILLSNILNYFSQYWGSNWGYNSLRDYEENLESITKSGGTIFLNYLFAGLMDLDFILIDGSKVTIHDLTDEDVYDFTDECLDGVLLKRIK